MNSAQMVGWECHVELRVVGFGGSPDLVSAILGLQPSRAWVAGDPRVRGPLGREAGWILKSGLPTTSAPAEQISALLGRLPKGIGGVGVGRDWRRFVLCAVYIINAVPPMYLEPALVTALAEFGLGLDVDMYVCPVGADDAAPPSAAESATARPTSPRRPTARAGPSSLSSAAGAPDRPSFLTQLPRTPRLLNRQRPPMRSYVQLETLSTYPRKAVLIATPRRRLSRGKAASKSNRRRHQQLPAAIPPLVSAIRIRCRQVW